MPSIAADRNENNDRAAVVEEQISMAPHQGLISLEDACETTEYAQIKDILRIVQRVSGTIFIFLMLLMLVLSNVDIRHPRHLIREVPVSIIVPCYNDAESVGDTVSSIFKTYPSKLIDLIVINDCSRDNSLEKLRELEKRFSFRLIDNRENKGKARSLNDTIPLAKYDTVLCIDADTILNKSALLDMLARMENDTRLGAVSAPYRPRNRGFLPAMQAIEYSMLLLTQGAHNVTSAMALWGGCIMVRKRAFAEVGGFYLNAITEDVDLAFRLNRKKWRVEQSFRPVRSLVPATLRGWIRQKLRWTSGGTQCYFRHVSVWIRNPIQLFFILSYSFFLASTIPAFFEGVAIAESLNVIWNDQLPLFSNIINVNTAFGADLLRRVGRIGLCCTISCIYVLPLIHSVRDTAKLLLIIPFSLVYFPVYMVVSIFGMAIGVRSLTFPKKSDTCGWKTT